jgi:mannose-1-phosphate guanylyltransferase
LPKQFADITGAGRTMIQATVDRILPLMPPENIYILTGERYRGLTQAQLPELPPENILAEPSGRNTAPAIGLACAHLQARDPQAVVAILSADHAIGDEAGYRAVLRQAERSAQAGYLTVLGIEPDHPHTGYGYIQRTGEPLAVAQDPSHPLPTYRVARFLEKPDLPTAQGFLAQGGYYWNGGTFVSRVDLLLSEMARQMPLLHNGLHEITQSLGTPQAEATLQRVWPTLPNTSIDYGVMENAAQVAVVPLDVGWNDVGSWDALESVLPADAQGNTLAQGEVILIHSQGCIVSGNERLIALVGVDDLVVVDTGDALLIGHKRKMQQVKDVVNQLKADARTDLL